MRFSPASLALARTRKPLRAASLLIRAAALALLVPVLPSQARAGTGARDWQAHVKLERLPDGSWIADYRFHRLASQWAFLNPAVGADGSSWRQAGWRVLTKGVSLTRTAGKDVLKAASGELRSVRILLRPAAISAAKGVAPAFAFSNGDLALDTGQFAVAPLDPASDRSGEAGDAAPLAVPTTMSAYTPRMFIAHGGLVHHGRPYLRIGGSGTYFFAGNTRTFESPSFLAILDPGLPGWLSEEFRVGLTRFFDTLETSLGYVPGRRAMLLVSWGGAGEPGLVYESGEHGGAAFVSLRGAGLLTGDAGVSDDIQLFLARQAARHWLPASTGAAAATGVLSEGASEWLALRVLEFARPGFDARAAWQHLIDDCVSGMPARTPLAGVRDEGVRRACGAILFAAGERALVRAGQDHLAIARIFVSPARTGTVRGETWLERLGKAAGNTALASAMRQFVSTGVEDPAVFLGTAIGSGDATAALDGDSLILPSIGPGSPPAGGRAGGG